MIINAEKIGMKSNRLDYIFQFLLDVALVMIEDKFKGYRRRV